jgi:predicted ATP-grasp superfamily ATP-dependent carboligase
VALPADRYPNGLVEVFAGAPPGPWMYTGGLENRPRLVRELSRHRALWGNGPEVLRQVRSPERVAACLEAAGLPRPAQYREGTPRRGRCLVKPRDGTGGRGITFWKPRQRRRGRVYFQEYIEGESCAAVYVTQGPNTHLLSVTRQLVGEAWLHAGPFQYCGSVGPLSLTKKEESAFRRLGDALGTGFGLRGLFGVDCVRQNGIPYPVEVNPRYTASVEVLEHGTGLPLLDLHRRAFDRVGTEPPNLLRPSDGVIGKAVLFAPAGFAFPAEGPWTATLRKADDPWEVPAFADIPRTGEHIPAGRPVLSFFTRAGSVASCLEQLRQTAAGLDRHLQG